MNHWFANPSALMLFGTLPFLGACLLWAWQRRRQALARFGSLLMVRQGPRWLRGACWFLAMLCVVVGVAGPQGSRDWKQAATPGRDLIVVLDCSRSMFAETPSRFERARTFALDLSESIQQRGGHRLGLIVFAGRARLVCPLTHDYDYFRETLKELDPETSDPELAPGPHDESGTRIGAALALAVRSQDTRFRGSRDILLLSDGDDPLRDGEWKQGAAAAKAEGIPVLVVGLGDPHTASTIPVGKDVLRQDDGKVVRTCLEETPLREIAHTTQGVYVPAHTQRVAAGPVYFDAVASLPLRDTDEDALPGYVQRYAWFYLGALILLVVATAIPDRLPIRLTAWRMPSLQEIRLQRLRPVAAALALGALGLLGADAISDPQTLLKDGDAAVARADYAAAVSLYEQAEVRTTEPGEVAYRLAVVKYHLAASTDNSDLHEAERLFRCCLSRENPHRAAALLGLGNCLLVQAQGHNLESARSAVEAYERCLREDQLPAPLAADAKQNLERAKLLALQLGAPATHEDKNQPPPVGDDGPNKPPRNERPKELTQTPDPTTVGKTDPHGQPLPVKHDPGRKPLETEEPPAPGVGNLPPISEAAEASSLLPQDAARHLEGAAQRVLQEREEYRRQKMRPVTRGVRDW